MTDNREEVITDGREENETRQGGREDEERLLLIGGRRSGRAASFVAMAEALRVRTGVEGPRPVLEANKLPAPIEAQLDREMKPGGRVVAESDGRAYRMQQQLGTLRRETPKVKGKSARRQWKKQRRLERERTRHIVVDEAGS